MAIKKISDLVQASSLNDGDYILIEQNGEGKKLKIRKFDITITNNTIPSNELANWQSIFDAFVDGRALYVMFRAGMSYVLISAYDEANEALILNLILATMGFKRDGSFIGENAGSNELNGIKAVILDV